MKITSVRTRVFEWKGNVVPPQAHFCTNATDILYERGDAMGSFRFHGWLVVEIETDSGLVGLGNCALAPRVAKEIIDLYLTPIVMGQDPFDNEYLWQKMYRRTHAWGRKGIGMAVADGAARAASRDAAADAQAAISAAIDAALSAGLTRDAIDARYAAAWRSLESKRRRT